MTIGIDADCSLSYWMSQGAISAPVKDLPGRDMIVEQVKLGLLPQWAYAPDGRAHLVVTNESERIRTNESSCGLAKTGLPRGAFLKLDGQICGPSPEYCFVRLSKMLDYPELVKAGMLMCSRFSFDFVGGLCEREEPLTTASKLRRFVSGVGNVDGIKRARSAVSHVVDNAASPPEIDTFLLLCLPVMRGGYGCPKPELNGHVNLSAKAARSLGYSDCYCDLLWREAKCAVEYTSELHHTGYQKQERDEIRRSALESMGYRVFFLTKAQLYCQPAFEGIVRPIMRALDKRMPKKTLKFEQAQHELRRAILYDPSWIIQNACRGQANDMHVISQ